MGGLAVNGGTISCGFGCDIFLSLLSLLFFFSFRSPGGCAGMHHTGLHSVSMWPLGCSGRLCSSAAWLESVCNPHGNPPSSPACPIWLHMALDWAGGKKSKSLLTPENIAAKVIQRVKNNKLNLRSSKIWSYLIIKILYMHVWIGFCVTELLKQTRKAQAK